MCIVLKVMRTSKRSVKRSVKRSTKKSVKHSVKRSTKKSAKRSVKRSTKKSVKRSVKRSIKKPSKVHPVKRSVKRSTIKPSKVHPVKRSVTRSTKKSFKRSSKKISQDGGVNLRSLVGLASKAIPTLQNIYNHPLTKQLAQAAVQEGKEFAINSAHDQIRQLNLKPETAEILKQATSQHINTLLTTK